MNLNGANFQLMNMIYNSRFELHAPPYCLLTFLVLVLHFLDNFLGFDLLAFVVYDASCGHNLSWESWHFYPYLISVTFCQVNTVKNDTLKLFDSIEKYGMCIFAFNFVEIKIPNNNFKVFILWVFSTALRNMVCVPLLLVLSFLIISFEFVHLMLSFVPLPFILPVDQKRKVHNK